MYGVVRPAKSMTLKTMKQQTQVNTLSVRKRKQRVDYKEEFIGERGIFAESFQWPEGFSFSLTWLDHYTNLC